MIYYFFWKPCTTHFSSFLLRLSSGKYLISYDEIKRRLQPPEKMSLRSLAAYTRVSRGPASKKTLLESLGVLGLTPGTTTSVSSYFSKLTEGDGGCLCRPRSP